MSRSVTFTRDANDLVAANGVVMAEKRIGEIISDASDESQMQLPTDDGSMMCPGTTLVRSTQPSTASVSRVVKKDTMVSTPPATAAVADEDEAPTCCICLDPYTPDNPMSSGTCNHHFHLPCLMEWKQRSNTCPMCCAETLYLADESAEADAAAARAATAAGHIDVSKDEEVARLLHKKFKRQQRQERRRAEERRKAAEESRQATLAATESDMTSAKSSTACTSRPPPTSETAHMKRQVPYGKSTTPQTQSEVGTRNTQHSLPPIKGPSTSSSSRVKSQSPSSRKEDGACVLM